MAVDLSSVTISATKPRGKVAKMLAAMGIRIVPIVEDEGNVDRYVLSKRLAIERRTGGGFIKGIMEKTLFTSAIYLREHFLVPALIIEGKVNYEHSMMNPQAVRGALSSMMLLYGVNVLASADAEETAELVMAQCSGVNILCVVPFDEAVDIEEPNLPEMVVDSLVDCDWIKLAQT